MPQKMSIALILSFAPARMHLCLGAFASPDPMHQPLEQRKANKALANGDLANWVLPPSKLICQSLQCEVLFGEMESDRDKKRSKPWCQGLLQQGLKPFMLWKLLN